MSIKLLDFPYTRGGVTYVLERQREHARLVRCTLPGSRPWWEVSERRVAPACVLGGKALPDRERRPSDEAFGRWAWTTRDPADALARLEAIDAARRERLETALPGEQTAEPSERE